MHRNCCVHLIYMFHRCICFNYWPITLKGLGHAHLLKSLSPKVNIFKKRVSSVVEHSSANPKVSGSIPGPVSYRGHGL